MTKHPVAPIVLKDLDLIFDVVDDFAAHVDSVTFTPSAQTITWTGGDSNTFTDVSTATWTCALQYQQDWTSADSLSQFLYEREGEQIPCNFRPTSGVGPSFTATLIITPGAIGGAINAYAAASVTLGCTGKPVLVPAV